MVVGCLLQVAGCCGLLLVAVGCCVWLCFVCCVFRAEISFLFKVGALTSREQQKTNWTRWKRALSMFLWNIDEHRTLFASWSGSTRFRILKTTVRAKVIHVQMAHIESRNDSARSAVIYVHMYSSESKAAIGMCINPKYKLHARRGTFTIFFMKKLKNLTSLFRTPGKVENSSGTSNAMCCKSTQLDRQDTDAESCSVKRRQWETSQHWTKDVSLTTGRQANQKRSSFKGVSFTKGEIIS